MDYNTDKPFSRVAYFHAYAKQGDAEKTAVVGRVRHRLLSPAGGVLNDGKQCLQRIASAGFLHVFPVALFVFI